MKDMDSGLKDFQVEFKLLSSDSNVGTFEGYGSVFNNVDNTNDIVAKGAFLDSIAQKKFPMLWQHDAAQPIGQWLEAKEDDKGLYLKGSLILEVAKAREAHALMKAGVLNGLSIGYRTKESSRDQKTGIRTLKKLDLLEVSLVTFPANESATVTAVKTKPETERELEKALRDLGYGRGQAKALIAGGWKAFNSMQRDADEGDDSDDVQRDADGLKTEAARLKSILNTINGESTCLMKSKN